MSFSNISTEVISTVLTNNGMEPTENLLDQIVTSATSELARIRALYDRFQADHLPILDKKVQNPNWSNYKLRANIEGHIVKLYTGFMNPFSTSYSVPKEEKEFSERLSQWVRANVIEKIDAETLQVSAACGMTYLYVNQGDQMLTNLRPYEVIPIYSQSTGNMDYALRYYTVSAYENDGTALKTKTVQYYEWYGPDKIIFYQKENGGMFKKTKEVVNLIKLCPVVMIPFNGNLESNYGDVKEMCDAFREILSTAADETVNIKWSLLKFLGVDQPDDTNVDANGETDADKFVKMIREAFTLFLKQNPGQAGAIDAQWLTKPLPKDFIEFMLDTLYEKILVLTDTFDPSFAKTSAVIASTTGPGMDYKLIPMKSKCAMAKTYFIDGMRKVFKRVVLCWNITGNTKYDPLAIDITFNFNIPVDRLSEMQYLQAADGVISQRTALANCMIIKDVDGEIQQMEQEREQRRQIYTDLDKTDEDPDNPAIPGEGAQS